MSNYDEKTGIAYGVISANSLDSFVFNEIFDQVYESYSEWLYEQWRKDLQVEYPELSEEEIEDKLLENIELSDIDEIEGEFELDGVKGQLTMLGGAYILFITYSKYSTYAPFCSPCCPGAGDLDSIGKSGKNESNLAWCYNVPPQWLNQE